MSGKTFGQTAREARQHAILDGADDAAAWEAGTQAVLNDAFPGLRAEIAELDGERKAWRATAEAQRVLIAEIFGEFNTASGDWYLAGVSQERFAQWQQRAGAEAS